MTQQAIIAPMEAMAALTFVVLLLVPIRRFLAGARRQVTLADFRFGESATVPPSVVLANRNYMNLLELPTLFYPACLLFFVAGRVTPVPVALAWAYVGLRAAHSLVHVTYNNVAHRLTLFGLSVATLAALWIAFFVQRLAA